MYTARGCQGSQWLIGLATKDMKPHRLRRTASDIHGMIIHRYNRTVYPKKYAHGFCFAVLCCGYTLTDFPISIRLTSLALWQSNDCPSASKATLMNMDKYFMWIHYERLHNHNKAKHNKTVCIFLGIYCIYDLPATGLRRVLDPYHQPSPPPPTPHPLPSIFDSLQRSSTSKCNLLCREASRRCEVAIELVEH